MKTTGKYTYKKGERLSCNGLRWSILNTIISSSFFELRDSIATVTQDVEIDMSFTTNRNTTINYLYKDEFIETK